MNKTTKIIIGIIVAIIVIGGIWYGVSKKPTPITEKKPIKIGYLAVLSGPAAQAWGFYGRDAAEMAVEEINAKGNIKLELILGDSAAKPEQGVTEFKKLNEINNPDVLIVDASGVGSAVAPMADQYKKPVIFGAVALKGITKQSDYLFRNFYLCDQSAPLLAEKAYTRLGVRKIAVLSAKEPYAESCFNEFKSKFNSLGGELVAEEHFLMTDSDFRTQLTKIKNTNADAIYIIGYENALKEIVKEMKELKINKTLLAEMVLYAPVIRNEIVDNTNPPEVYLTVTNYYLGSEKANEFRNKFKEKYGKEPPYLAGYIYDTIYIIAKAAEISRTKDISLKEALKEVDLNGVSGYLKFNENRETISAMEFVKLNKDGSLEIIK
jgi:branched-chain amino acid transport system substrate-binding protein